MNDVSTATLRNELNSLEAMGYLAQLHTSGGRVPTTKGYRFFVDEILKNTKFSTKKLDTVKKDLFSKTANLTEIVGAIADIVSKTTKLPAVVVLDGFENLVLHSIKLMLLISGQMLVLIDTNAGVITNTVSISASLSKDDCDNATGVFTDIFAGKTLGFLMQNIDNFNDSIRKAMKSYEQIFEVVLGMLKDYRTSGTTSNGMLKLLDSPEYSDIDKAKSVLTLLDDKNKLNDIFDTEDEEGVTVKIGDENKQSELDTCSVIKAPIVLGGNKVASIGVIGPKRLDYATVASVLKIIADQLNKG